MDDEKKRKISDVIFYSKKYGEELPEIGSLAIASMSDLDRILRKYLKREEREDKRGWDSVIAYR